jgi:hypothetical protein
MIIAGKWQILRKLVQDLNKSAGFLLMCVQINCNHWLAVNKPKVL